MSQFMKPTGQPVLPRRLNLPDFIQFLLVGLSGIRGDLVRQKAQLDPPKQPNLEVNWIAFEINSEDADFNPYTYVDSGGTTQFQRHVTLVISCAFYGPNALPISNLVRDGFQIQQNRYWLSQARMGFVEVDRAMRIPDLVNDRWVNRYERNITIRHQVLRAYPVPTFGSASGILNTVVGNQDYPESWQSQNS